MPEDKSGVRYIYFWSRTYYVPEWQPRGEIIKLPTYIMYTWDETGGWWCKNWNDTHSNGIITDNKTYPSRQARVRFLRIEFLPTKRKTTGAVVYLWQKCSSPRCCLLACLTPWLLEYSTWYHDGWLETWQATLLLPVDTVARLIDWLMTLLDTILDPGHTWSSYSTTWLIGDFLLWLLYYILLGIDLKLWFIHLLAPW
jgi:hypothetical protein